MFDLSRTRYSLTQEYPVVPAATVLNEGAITKDVLVNGVANTQLTDGLSATEPISGFSINNNIVPGTQVYFETDTVPATSAYTVQLANGSLVSGQVYVYDVTAAAALTVVTSTPLSGQAWVNLTSGLVTFNASAAGHSIQFVYRWNLTVIQQTIIYRQRPVNAASNTAQGTITVGRGNGNLFTDQYDVTQNFSNVNGLLYAGPNGLITVSTAGSYTPIPGSRVIHVPTAADPFLGLTFNLA